MDQQVKIKHFTDCMVWQKAHALFLCLLKDVESFPRRQVGSILTDQILRSRGSISATIAEGFNRSTKKFLNSLDIAIGETNETENWLDKIRDAGFLPLGMAEERMEQTQVVGRMLNGLIRSLNKCES